MSKLRWFVPVLMGRLLLCAAGCGAVTITENFSSDPLGRGWTVFGNTNLFQWDATNQNLRVTWDSSQPNSYFYHSLGTMLDRQDDFSIEFDLNLSDIAGGTEPGTTGPMQIGLGFLNFQAAINSSFMRGGWGSAPNVVEFDYYPWGYFEYGGVIYDSPAAALPSLSPASGYVSAPAHVASYDRELPTNQTIHVTMTFTASNQTVAASVATNGVLVPLPGIVLTDTNDSAFTATDDYHVNIFSISSYSSLGAFGSSVLGHGTVDNLAVTVLPPPVQNVTGGFTNSVWCVEFLSSSNWLYTLERTTDFQSWTNISPTAPGTAMVLSLQDTNRPESGAFYRVRAERP
jgi:hypothetical protein